MFLYVTISVVATLRLTTELHSIAHQHLSCMRVTLGLQRTNTKHHQQTEVFCISYSSVTHDRYTNIWLISYFGQINLCVNNSNSSILIAMPHTRFKFNDRLYRTVVTDFIYITGTGSGEAISDTQKRETHQNDFIPQSFQNLKKFLCCTVVKSILSILYI